MMDLFSINRETCNKDGICAAVCPTRIIDFKKGGIPSPGRRAEEMCIRCGHCVAACPTGSFSHREITVADCDEIREEYKLSSPQVEQFLRQRRSIRDYKDKPVSREDLVKLIEVARYAPSGHNSQCTEWIVFDKRQDLDRLTAMTIEWMRWMLENMKELALHLLMDEMVLAYEKGSDGVLRNAPVLIITHAEKDNVYAPVTCTIALAYLELAATGMGLGTCFAGYIKAAENFYPHMKAALGLPENHECMGAMMVGYPKFNYHRLPPRKKPPITFR